jgi:hypothetical protein
MRNLRRLAWAVAAVLATVGPAAAQQGGTPAGNTGGNLGTFGTNTTGGNISGLNTAGSSTGSSAGSAGTTGSIGGTELTVERAPVIKAPSSYASGSTNKGVQASANFLGASYANPYAQGILLNSRNASYNPGAFGVVTFGTATGATGTAGGAGATATTGRAGAAGTGLTTDPGGQLVQLPRQIAYTAQLKFAAPMPSAPRLVADLRGTIDRAPSLANPAGVQVQVDGNAVVLRGTVRDGEEARLVEGLVRLTPGVGRIANELTYPR